MPEDKDRLEEFFGKDPKPSGKKLKKQPKPAKEKKVPDDSENAAKKKSRKLFIDENGDAFANYTGEDTSERDYRPIRQSREYKSGCLGGILYFLFIACVSICLAVFMWMAVADALSLNGSADYVASITLPQSIFSTKTIEIKDEEGNVTGTERVSSADIEYVASELKEAGIIEYTWLFKAFCQLSNADRKFDAGEYTVKGSYDYRAIVQAMRRGAGGTKTVTVTIPEGFTMLQIFDRLEENGVASKEDLYEAAANATFSYWFLEGKEPGDASRLEGFLFPETYEFYVGMNASSAIKKFLDTFNYRFETDLQRQLENLNISIDDAIKIASIIEKEAGRDEERGNIASVIFNRIKSNMQLGLDSTILYVYPEHEGAPNAEMLEDPSPYNTRINFGLPPTPISNPGMPSIHAAINPTTTGYYYFALEKESNTMQFFRNYNEFSAFVARQNYDE